MRTSAQEPHQTLRNNKSFLFSRCAVLPYKTAFTIILTTEQTDRPHILAVLSMIIFKPAKRKKLRKNAVATPSNSALRNLFPTNNQLIKKIQNEKKLLSTAPTHGHARPPNAKPVRRGRTQRNRNLLDHHRKTILTARRQSATEYLRSSTSKKLSITYIEKIIRNFQLFVLEEDGSFSPEELNPVKKKEKKNGKK